ncbi:MAG: flagellar hook-associated protein FlgL [Bdellovibrionales bacterium]|nr:flagellar hook-associated protein FlgL [Bdellovibrionales bacterium]
MRITERNNFETVRDSISRSRGRMDGLQHQAATLKRINAPSDDPIGSSKILEIRTDKVNNDQFQMNAKLAESFLMNTDHTLGELADIVVRAKEIALGQSSGASSNDETRVAVAEEITQLYKQSVAAANRRIGDRYLFGGYKTHQPPILPDGQYRGDNGEMMVEIARDVFISSNVPGSVAFNTQPTAVASPNPELTDQQRRGPAGSMDEGGPRPENINLFDELQALRVSLLAGDISGVRDTLERFDALHGTLISNRAKVGSRLMGIQSTASSLERHNLTNAQLNSALEDADMSRVVSDLAKEETVFKSSLASAQKLIQPTLLDFIR